MELFIRQDVTYNHGLCLIDPHGDVVDAILDYIPRERIEDVCIIDPTDVDFLHHLILLQTLIQCLSSNLLKDLLKFSKSSSVQTGHRDLSTFFVLHVWHY